MFILTERQVKRSALAQGNISEQTDMNVYIINILDGTANKRRGFLEYKTAGLYVTGSRIKYLKSA